jgi:hypothetical protein
MTGDWFDGAGNGAAVDAIELLNGGNVGKGIAELVDDGALVSMGKTSDGGAIGVTVTVDGRWRREYFRNEDELVLWLAEAIPAVKAARSAKPASRVAGNGQRGRARL